MKWIMNRSWVKRATMIAALDILSVVCAFFLALWMRYDFRINDIEPVFLQTYAWLIPVWCGISVIVFAVFGLYNSVWSFVSVDELFRIFGAYSVLLAAEIFLYKVLGIRMPRSYYILGLLLSFGATVCLRFAYRFLRQLRSSLHLFHHGKELENVMIVGAGDAGRSLIEEFANNHHAKGQVCCFVDDNASKWGKRLQNVPIVGGRDKIRESVEKYHIKRIIYAIPSSSAKTRKDILDICTSTGCQVQVVPGIYQLMNGEVTVSKLREVEVQDLLGREPIQVNLDEIFQFISGKVVMVTGGGGSIGSELCRQIAAHNPKQLIIVDIYENTTYDVQNELKKKFPNLNLVVLL